MHNKVYSHLIKNLEASLLRMGRELTSVFLGNPKERKSR